MSKEDIILDKLFKKMLSSLSRNKLISDVDYKNMIFYSIFKATNKKRSKIFYESALKFIPTNIPSTHLIEIDKDGEKHYALSYKGISNVLENKYSIDKSEQFNDVLDYYESELKALTEPKPLVDKEIVAALSLIILSSVSNESAIRLNSSANQNLFERFLLDIIPILKEYKMIKQNYKLKTPSRGESKASALMARLDMLPIKTMHKYKNIRTESGYYFDLIKNDKLQTEELKALFRLIFKNYDPYEKNNDELYSRLFHMSISYNLKFLDRTVNNDMSYEIIKKMKSYLDLDIFL